MSDNQPDEDVKRWRAVMAKLKELNAILSMGGDGSWGLTKFGDRDHVIRCGDDLAELDAYLAGEEPEKVVVSVSLPGICSGLETDLLPGQSEVKSVGDITVTIKRDDS